jgi:hypothetical protein
MLRPWLAAALLAAACAAPAAAQRWSVAAGTGSAYNVPLPLTIEQRGQPDLKLTAHWGTRPFKTPLYYVARVERGTRGGAFAVEWIHHKLFLDNAPADVQHFEISHGFNVVTLQRSWDLEGGFDARAAAGVIVAHPETIVRTLKQPRGGWQSRGYYVAGPTAQVGGGWSLRLAANTRPGLEARLIGAHAWVPIAEGSARLWHASGHLDLVARQSF